MPKHALFMWHLTAAGHFGVFRKDIPSISSGSFEDIEMGLVPLESTRKTLQSAAKTKPMATFTLEIFPKESLKRAFFDFNSKNNNSTCCAIAPAVLNATECGWYHWKALKKTAQSVCNPKSMRLITFEIFPNICPKTSCFSGI